MAFTAQEKQQAIRFVLGMIEHAKGLETLADVAETRGHNLRAEILRAFSSVRGVWEHSRIWFAFLADGFAKTGWTRAMGVAEAKKAHGVVMHYANDLLTYTASRPEFSAAHAHFVVMRDQFAGFDWSFTFENPRHNNNPNTPFDEAKTIVGPHGDWNTATNSLMFVMWYIGETSRDLDTLYRSPAIFPEEANGPVSVLLMDIAHLMNRVSRVYAMHLECESPQDEATINADHAAASGARSRDFHRAMLQLELLYNQRASVGQNWRGRPFETGAVSVLDFSHITNYMVPVANANGEQWTWNMVIADAGQFGGPYAGYTAKIVDFWQVLDAWAQSALGFYHTLPDPTIFKPVEPEPPPPGSTTIPLGFFNAQAAQIAQSKAEVSIVSAELDALLASFRALEGSHV